MIGPRTLCLLALCAAALTVGAAPAAADPYDAQPSSRAFSASFLPTLPFALGEVDLTTLGVPDSAFATVGPSATASGDGPNMYIVDDNLAQCPNAAYTSIQAAVNASGPGDQIRVCPGLYQEQVDIGPGHDGLTVFSQQPLQAVIKAPLVMNEPGDIVRIHNVQDVTIRHFEITGPLPDTLFCSLQTRTGVRIDEAASATLRDNHITEVRSTSPLLRGCQNGIAVLVGRRFNPLGGPTGTTGTAWITHNLIDEYQKGGIVVDNQDSFGTIDHNEIVGPGPQPVIAPNGIQVSRNAAADVSHNIVTENSYVGVDNGTGILLFRPQTDVNPPFGPFPAQIDPINIHHNKVFLNDDGIALYDTDISFISHNRSYQQRRYDGIYVNPLSMGNTIDHNDAYLNSEHDCHDDSAGTGTAGTANFWIHDKGDTQNRAGLCKGATIIP